jgi:hypothetical protein
MPIQHPHPDIVSDVNRILFSAGELLHYVRSAYKGGTLQLSHLEATFSLRDDMGQMLARFEDGHDYGLVWPKQLETMREYETMATDMIDAVCEPKDSA